MRLKINNIILFVISLMLFQQVKAKDSSFIVVGHGDSLFKDLTKLHILVQEINKLNPEYVFILGDCDVHDSVIYQKFSGITAKVLYSPGNHDLVKDSDREEYQFRITYLDTTFQDDNFNFVLLNSSESIDNVNSYLAEHLIQNDTVLNLVFCHHRIWTDNNLDDIPYGNQKSYLFREIQVESRANIDYIFSGNVNRIQSIYQNCIYNVDMVENITAFSCGMGYSKMTFVEFKYMEGLLLPVPHYISFKGDHVIYTRQKLKEKKRTYNKMKEMLILLFAGIAFLELIFLLILLKRRNRTSIKNEN